MLDASTDREDPWTLTRCSGWAAVANQDGLVGWITRRLLEAELRAPKYHALARHPLAERWVRNEPREPQEEEKRPTSGEKTPRPPRAEKRPAWHQSARPPLSLREATHRAITFAEFLGAPLLLVHVSGREAVAEIAAARGDGRGSLPIFGETCPQYLTLTAEKLKGWAGRFHLGIGPYWLRFT
jgi:hypothetical protein